MTVYIALLRGINVGGKNRLPMAELVTIFESLGYPGAHTYIQSGNVVFASSVDLDESAGTQISEAIYQQKGFQPQLLLLSAAQLQAAVEANPFHYDSGKALHFFFLASQPSDPDLDKLTRLRSATEQFKLSERVFYLSAPDGIGRSKLAAAVEAALGVVVTARNGNTVNKLVAMAEAR